MLVTKFKATLMLGLMKNDHKISKRLFNAKIAAESEFEPS
jgi:hypothetical protein